MRVVNNNKTKTGGNDIVWKNKTRIHEKQALMNIKLEKFGRKFKVAYLRGMPNRIPMKVLQRER